jgi:hypothetical protein
MVVLLLVTAAVLLATATVQAFDRDRKGFIIGLGGGLGVTSFTQEANLNGHGVKSDRETDFSLATDFRIGGGISNQFMLYYENRVAWFRMASRTGTDVTIADGVGLVGASYYFQTRAPSAYILGSVGTSSWMAPFESNSKAWTGLGLSGGFGYEFSPRISIEATINRGTPSRDFGGLKLKTNAISALVALCYIWY